MSEVKENEAQIHDVLIEGDEANLRYRYDPTKEPEIADVMEAPFYETCYSYPIEDLKLREPHGYKELDLMALLPKGWKIGCSSLVGDKIHGIRDTSHVLSRDDIIGYYLGLGVNTDARQIHIGDLEALESAPPGKGKIEETPQKILTRVLTARAVEQYRTGVPDGKIGTMQEVLARLASQRADEVMEGLANLTVNSAALARKPYDLSALRKF